MATATSLPPAPEAEVREYVKVWAENASQVLTQIAGVSFALECTVAPPSEVPDPLRQDLQ
jgi:hypothetical protein